MTVAQSITEKETYEEKIQWAMSTIEDHSDEGFCYVASRSEGLPHIVTVDKFLYSQTCTCKAALYGLDCYHCIAVTRYFDDRRPSFYEQCGLMRESTTTVTSVEQFLKDERKAQVVTGTCGHRVKYDPSRSCGCDQ